MSKAKTSLTNLPNYCRNNFRQDKVEGPCGNWYNQTFIESLNRPKPRPSAITANRVANQENRRRPSIPALPRRQEVFKEQIPEKPLPQQLADLERFGQPKGEKNLSPKTSIITLTLYVIIYISLLSVYGVIFLCTRIY